MPTDPSGAARCTRRPDRSGSARDCPRASDRRATPCPSTSTTSTPPAFYVDVLGLTVRGDRPDLRVEGPGSTPAASRSTSSWRLVPAGLGQHFALQVDDLDAAVARAARPPRPRG